MTFDVFRYAEAADAAPVTSASPHDPAKVAAALAHVNCIGVAENVSAVNEWDAMERGGKLIAAGQCRRGPRGRELPPAPAKGGVA